MPWILIVLTLLVCLLYTSDAADDDRGVFGTQKNGGILNNELDLKFKNIANTHVVKLGDEILALWEAAGPHAMDPDTLDTIGLTTLKGVLKPNEAFSAHPKTDLN